jgi:hypothetical protein
MIEGQGCLDKSILHDASTSKGIQVEAFLLCDDRITGEIEAPDSLNVL